MSTAEQLIVLKGGSVAALKQFKEAEAALLEVFPLIENGLGSDHNFTLQGVQHLVDLYDTWHVAEPNAGYDAKADKWRTKLPPPVEEEETSPETERELNADKDN